jgi:hypothetical protein
MNDFSDLEKQLKDLRPAPLRENFVARVEQAMAEPAPVNEAPDNIIRPARFRTPLAIGLSLAAAAAVILLLRINFRAPERANRVASASSPASQLEPSRSAAVAPDSIAETKLPVDTFIPAQTTQVIYHKRDEGLLFAKNTDQPLRRVRSLTQETLQWHNPATGASLRVSYPSEQVQLIPVSGQ